MDKLNKVMNLKALVAVTICLIALSSFISEPVQALANTRGNSESLHCNADGTEYCDVDPSPGTFFDGRITIRFNRERVFPINQSNSSWFGIFSNQPQIPFPDIGDGLFASNTPFKLFKPNEALKVSYCSVRLKRNTLKLTDSNFFRQTIDCYGDAFNPFVSLPLSKQSPITFFNPQELFPNDDFLAVSFDFANKGITINTKKSFNFFGFSYQFNQKAFDNKVVGISLVKPGTGDIGLVPLEGFNIVNCIPQGSPKSKFATDRCGEQEFPLDLKFITQSEVVANSSHRGFFYDFNKKEGTLATGEPFQLFDDSFLEKTVK